MESSAELLYLSDNFDTDNVFGFDNKREVRKGFRIHTLSALAVPQACVFDPVYQI